MTMPSFIRINESSGFCKFGLLAPPLQCLLTGGEVGWGGILAHFSILCHWEVL